MTAYPALDVTEYWATVNDDLLTIVDAIPDDKINWSPKPELWNFRGILLHIADARDGWLARDVKDGVEAPSVWQTTRSKAEIQREYRRTWERLERFVRNRAQLDKVYDLRRDDSEPTRDRPGHWIAWHLIEHDIHHRADLLHYLALLGEPMPDVAPL